MLDGWTDRVPALHGDLTTLREVAASDVYTLFTLFSDPAVTAYMAPPPPTLAKFAGFVEWSHQQRAQGHGVCFGIVPVGMTAAVGILQVRLEPTSSDAEWGFVLSTHFWSTGVFCRRGQRARGVCVHDHAHRASRSAHRSAQSARTRRRAKTRCAVRDDARGVVTTGHSARSRVGVDPAGTRLAEPDARSSWCQPTTRRNGSGRRSKRRRASYGEATRLRQSNRIRCSCLIAADENRVKEQPRYDASARFRFSIASSISAVLL